jgi:hypothetical protein
MLAIALPFIISQAAMPYGVAVSLKTPDGAQAHIDGSRVMRISIRLRNSFNAVRGQHGDCGSGRKSFAASGRRDACGSR